MGCQGHRKSKPGGHKLVTPESGAKQGQAWIPRFQLFQTQQQLRKRYGKFGPNPIIYLGLLHRLALILVVCSFAVTIPLLIINYNGNGCNETGFCRRQGILYKLSILNLIHSEVELKVQAGIWLAVSLCLTLIFIPLRAYAVSSYYSIDDENTTQSDFSVILRRIPTDATREDIERLFTQDILYRIATKYNMNSVQAQKLLKIKDIIILYRMDKTLAKFNKEVSRFQKLIPKNQWEKFKLQDIPRPDGFSGTAIVIFNCTQAVDEIKKIIRRKFYELVIEYIFPFISPRTQFKIKQKNISIFQAPEPSAILWQNIGRTNFKKIMTKILFTFYVILLVVASSLATYYVSYFQQSSRKIQQNTLYVSIVASIVVFVFNFLIEQLLRVGTQRLKIDTKANFLVQSLNVIIIHQSINLAFSAILVPIIMYYPFYFQGFIDLDVPTTMIVLMCSKVAAGLTLQFLYDYFEIKIRIYKFLVKRQIIYQTQHKVNQMLRGVELCFDSKYASIIQIVWFGFIFSVISPLCLPIGAAGLILLCIQERILFNSKYRIPTYTSLKLQHQFINLLRFVSLCIGLSNIIVHKSISMLQELPFDPLILSMNLTNIAVGGAACLIPWDKVFICLNLGVKHKAKLGYDEQQFSLSYQQANPLNSWKLVEYFASHKAKTEKDDNKQTVSDEKYSQKQSVSTPDDIPTERPFKTFRP